MKSTKGRKTLAQIRRDNAKRQERYRANRKNSGQVYVGSFLDKATHAELKRCASDHGLKLQDLVTEIISSYLVTHLYTKGLNPCQDEPTTPPESPPVKKSTDFSTLSNNHNPKLP